MSNWTHVAAIVRVDSLRIFDEDDIDFCKVFGKEVHFEDSEEVWADYDAHKEDYLPTGSEGSLRMTVWTNPKRNYMDAYTVSIFGDLRDHDDPKTIIDWFKEKCASLDIVRNACIISTNEWNGTETWHYDYGDET